MIIQKREWKVYLYLNNLERIIIKYNVNFFLF